MNSPQKIAVIGSGISGLTCAYLLNQAGHDVHLFEKDARLGGHTHTTPTEIDGKTYPIDSGFIVFNDWTYPHFIKLMNALGVESQPTTMSFSAFERDSDFVYSGSNLRGLFANPKHVLSVKFWRMLADIVRFNKRAIADFEAENISPDISLSDYLHAGHYGDWFVNRYILPMGGAIWSSSNRDIEHFPALFFVRFFHHHGLLNIKNRPQWRVIKNGSSSYIEAMNGKLGTVHVNAGIESVQRDDKQVFLHTANGSHTFDEVIFACHSDQALNILGDNATQTEREILGAMPYRPNAVSVHVDETLLPQKTIARSSWNVALGKQLDDIPMLSYCMNILQGFTCDKAITVSVNCDAEIDPKKILYQADYDHPTFTAQGINAQARHKDISGHNHTHFAGAYWFNGFHEDGVKSAIRVCEHLGVRF